jgi:ribosomal protein S18 acetylase RimI-like enzyme
VAVDPARRGAGIGSVLLDHAEQAARTTGCRRIVLDVAVDNEGARRLYARRGMAIEARSPTIPFTSGNAVYRMAVTVTPDPVNQP